MVLIVVIVAAALNSATSSTQFGDTCVTVGGNCPLVSAAPVGDTCECPAGFAGTVQ